MVLSLKSLLEIEDDFDLVIIDSGSRDKTVEYLETIQDKRIIQKIYFPDNLGGTPALNKGLMFRKPEQDWINFEYDCIAEDKNMVTILQQCNKVMPNTIFSGMIPNILPKDFKSVTKENVVFYESLIAGYCLYIPGNIMDKLMFYDEETSLQDQEINRRAMSTGAKVGYLENVQCKLIGVDCLECKKHQSICNPLLSVGEVCINPYSRITSLWCKEHYEKSSAMFEQKIKEGKITCGTRYIENSLTELELERSLMHSSFFTEKYNEHLKSKQII